MSDKKSYTRFPFGAADVQALVGADLAADVAVTNGGLTILNIGTLSAAVTLNLDLLDDIPVGASLIVEVSQGATGRNVTLGTGFDGDAPVLTGVASDVDAMEFYFDGTAFVNKTALWQKRVDAA